MIKIEEKSTCSGCAACYNSCDYDAITMQYDGQGFAYPVINKSLCVDCQSCEESCPYLHIESLPDQTAEHYPCVYACYTKNETVRKLSTSGGIFSVLAEKIIDEAGVVFAARFDEKFHIIHSKIEHKDDIPLFRGSKYPQSELGYCYRGIKKTLEDNQKVLFIGMPCQVAGLRQYLNREYDNLFTVDFICMGVASPVIWENYLKDFEDSTTLQSVVFKDKRDGWHNWKIKFMYPDKERFAAGADNLFFNGYLSHLYMRPSCFSCPCKGVIRTSDFTIGDCWGIDKIDPEFDDNKGVSALIVQSEKGRLLFEKIKKDLIYRPIAATDVIQYNRHSVVCAPVNPKTDAFYRDLESCGFKYAMQKYCNNKKNIFSRIKGYIKRQIKWV